MREGVDMFERVNLEIVLPRGKSIDAGAIGRLKYQYGSGGHQLRKLRQNLSWVIQMFESLKQGHAVKWSLKINEGREDLHQSTFRSGSGSVYPAGIKTEAQTGL